LSHKEVSEFAIEALKLAYAIVMHFPNSKKRR
jgi:hypothetical protein